MSRQLRGLAALLLALITMETPASPAAASTVPADQREGYEEGVSPPWLRAVGRLTVPGIRYENGRRRHHTERCSATLVQTREGRVADTIVTAWHCLEFYEDLTQRILFSVPTAAGPVKEVEARRVADGGSIEADWAILRLREPISPQQAPSLALDRRGVAADTPLVMAGFSRDSGTGSFGRRLSYDPLCRVTRLLATYTDSDCRAHKGASGGAVIRFSENGQPRLTGVISQGDGAGLSRFVPVTVFRQSLARHLR